MFSMIYLYLGKQIAMETGGVREVKAEGRSQTQRVWLEEKGAELKGKGDRSYFVAPEPTETRNHPGQGASPSARSFCGGGKAPWTGEQHQLLAEQIHKI